MQDIHSILAGLNRPKLLVQAARFGLDHYRRATQLPRILGQTPPKRPGPAAMLLVTQEAELEAQRQANSAEYSATAHIETLIALMAEAQLLRTQPKHLQVVT